MHEIISGTPKTVEERREMFVGKQGREAVTLLIACLPQMEEFSLEDYTVRRTDIDESGNFNDEPPVVKTFLRDRVFERAFWGEQFLELKDFWEIFTDDFEDGEFYIGFCSKVRVGGYMLPCHVPMMDFLLEFSKQNTSRLINLLREREEEGILLNSGRSYHYYGLRTLSQGNWKKWMYDWLWNADNKFIAYSLRKGYSTLRLTSGFTKPQLPQVIEIV